MIIENPVEHDHESHGREKGQHAHEYGRDGDVAKQPFFDQELIEQPLKTERALSFRNAPPRLEQDHISRPEFEQTGLVVKNAQAGFGFEVVNEGAAGAVAVLDAVDNGGPAVGQEENGGNKSREPYQFSP